VFNNRNPFSEISEKDPSRASGWVQAAHWAFGYVQVRQGKYQGMSAPAARRRPQYPNHFNFQVGPNKERTHTKLE